MGKEEKRLLLAPQVPPLKPGAAKRPTPPTSGVKAGAYTRPLTLRLIVSTLGACTWWLHAVSVTRTAQVEVRSGRV